MAENRKGEFGGDSMLKDLNLMTWPQCTINATVFDCGSLLAHLDWFLFCGTELFLDNRSVWLICQWLLTEILFSLSLFFCLCLEGVSYLQRSLNLHLFWPFEVLSMLVFLCHRLKNWTWSFYTTQTGRHKLFYSHVFLLWTKQAFIATIRTVLWIVNEKRKKKVFLFF